MMYLTINIELYLRQVNFLSHYYFDRYADSPELVLGGVLPDLLKNVDKDYSFQFSKFDDKLSTYPKHNLITQGWSRHIEIDKIFHSHDFFYEHTQELRKQIAPIVEDLPIRASFLAHIGLELMLDHILIEKHLANTAHFYEKLEAVDRDNLRSYLQLLGDINIARFDRFYDRFISTKYIFEYSDINNLPYPLFNICRRVWDFKENQTHIDRLALQLASYKQQELSNFKSIYVFIEDKLT